MNDTFTSNNNIYGIFQVVSENPNIIILYGGTNSLAGVADFRYNTDGCSGPETGTCNITPPDISNFPLLPIIMNNGQIGLYTHVRLTGDLPKLYLSSDGINYTLKSTVPTTQVTASKIIFVDSFFYCLINSISEPSLFRSPNGIDWTMISPPKSIYHGIVSNKNGFLIGRSFDGMCYSYDNGLTWTINTTTYGSVYMPSLVYSPERKEFLGFIKETCNFYYSKDGITFTNYIFQPDTDISIPVGSLMYIGFDVCRYFIPYIDKSTGFCSLCVSSDGLNWNTRIVTNTGRIGNGPGNIAYSNNYKRFFRMWYNNNTAGPHMTYSTRSSNTSANNFITSKLIPTNNNELASKLYVDSTKKSLLAIFGCNKITANKNYYEFNGNTTSIESSQTSTTTKFIVPFALTVTNVSYLFSQNVSPFASFAILKNNITQGNLIANTTDPNTILNGAIALATPVSFVAGDTCEVVGTSDSIITGQSLIVLYFN